MLDKIPAGRGMSETSQAAFNGTNMTRNRNTVLEAIAAHGHDGCISDQIQKSLKWMPYGSVTNHFRYLLNSGLIEVIGRRAGLTGRSQRIYRVTPAYFSLNRQLELGI